ncbi:pantetheine-phosphate adenylyltransferase [Desulfovibrio inopinatus]|uniref:pantetheine-phosphate adenylyltransferase n=1 Tax=Desulfovibrio inopinatus TaxID=102109 RepID=UPI0004135C1F|nr:pantetheine-phosphate adenylyltransferase [Desulfovibrio inopinatus]
MAKHGCVAVYPGSFDPLTNGHVSLVKRALNIYDSVIVSVARNSQKKPLFTVQERVEMAAEVFADEPAVMVESFEGLLVDYVKRRKTNVILRGLRAVSDFEYEFQMALMNRKLERTVETVFLMTDFRWLYISSTIIKEAARLGGDVTELVPALVVERLQEKYGVVPLPKTS